MKNPAKIKRSLSRPKDVLFAKPQGESPFPKLTFRRFGTTNKIGKLRQGARLL